MGQAKRARESTVSIQASWNLDAVLADYPAERLERLRKAGQIVENCVRVLRKTTDNVVGELLRGQGTFFEWQHYPPGDIYDPETHSQYYYHAHPKESRPGEHGHFHTFLRAKGMAPGTEPVPIEGFVEPTEESARLSHLVAISMDRKGDPIHFFTTNRWVTGEVWYGAADVIAMLDYFEIDHARPSWPVNIWLTNMLRLFRPQIEWLVRRRDQVIEARSRRSDYAEILEDRSLEITSSLTVDVASQVAAVGAAIDGRVEGP
jgi:hypothetical protein